MLGCVLEEESRRQEQERDALAKVALPRLVHWLSDRIAIRKLRVIKYDISTLDYQPTLNIP